MEIEEIYSLAVQYRRHLHRYPELSTLEFETQDYIAGILDKHGIVYRKIGTGIIAYLGKGERCVAIRTDMDALRVREETGLEYASENDGIMHACGHDMHMAMVLGATLALKDNEEELQGVVKVIFQPSEEKRPGGARLLLPYVLEEPIPQAIFAQHIFPNLSTGKIGIRPGAFFASSDNIILSVKGKGTHAAMPQLGSDPILAVAHLIQYYQSIVTKFRNPLIPAVLSITAVHGGTCNNVIPDQVDLLGTVRTHDNALRYRIFELIEEKSTAICGLYGCTFSMDKTWNGLPVLVNDKHLTSFVTNNAVELIGQENVQEMDPLTLGEDFAIYLERIPGVLWILGVCPVGTDSMPPLHNPHLSPDEKAISTGIDLLVKNCMEFLTK